MYSKEEHENLLKEIAATGGDTDSMLELLQKLRDDFDEREGELRRYNEAADKSKPDTENAEEKIVDESKEDNVDDKGLRRDPIRDDVVSRSEYDELKRKYIERFFSDPEQAKRDQEEDIKDDGKDLSFDNLFKKKEG